MLSRNACNPHKLVSNSGVSMNTTPHVLRLMLRKWDDEPRASSEYESAYRLLTGYSVLLSGGL